MIRLVNLGTPNYLIFDETYYAKDAWTLSHLGYESSWPEDANDQIAQGVTDIYNTDPSFIVHPQLGKWIIAAGEHIFGMNSFGWRIGACVFGTILIIATIRLARRLSRSTLVGAIAGILLTFDGLAFVMSRIALLDIFQAAFTVIAVACVVCDRDWLRTRLADFLTSTYAMNLGGSFGPLYLFRPWRWAAGFFFGCAIACKWNTLYLLAAMGIVSVISDLTTRRTAGASKTAIRSILIEAPLAFCYLVVTAVVVYVASWFSWLRSTGGWGRDYGATNPDDFWVKLLGAPLGSLIHYQRQIYEFHTGDWIAEQTHTYNAYPATWPFMGRVIGIDAVNSIQPGTDGCPTGISDTCLRVISGTGTPILWWCATAATIVGIVLWIANRDWRFAFPVISALVPWIMWFPSADRPVFFFYAIIMIPFTVTCLAILLGRILGPADDPRRKRRAWIVGGIIIAVIVNFWFIYPILTDQLMTRSAWAMRMWLRSWI